MAKNKMTFGLDDLELIHGGLSEMIDRYVPSMGNFDEIEALEKKIGAVISLEPEVPKWKEGNSPLKVVSPEGKTFNLRVVEDREALLAKLNGV